jgi:hypothetical protein
MPLALPGCHCLFVLLASGFFQGPPHHLPILPSSHRKAKKPAGGKKANEQQRHFRLPSLPPSLPPSPPPSFTAMSLHLSKEIG